MIIIVSLLNKKEIQTNVETLGFVFPNFCITIPIPLYDFLDKTDLSSAKFFSAVCTRGGSFSEAFDYTDEILHKQGKKLNAQLDINMPWNNPITDNLPGLNSEEKTCKLESIMHDKLDRF